MPWDAQKIQAPFLFFDRAPDAPPAQGTADQVAAIRTRPIRELPVQDAYAAAIGTILGACILLGRIAVGDWLTALLGVVSLAVLFRWRVSNPMLIAATAGGQVR